MLPVSLGFFGCCQPFCPHCLLELLKTLLLCRHILEADSLRELRHFHYLFSILPLRRISVFGQRREWLQLRHERIIGRDGGLGDIADFGLICPDGTGRTQ